MNIRQMREADIPAIQEMANSEAGFQVSLTEDSCFWTREQLENWIESGDDVLLVAEEDDKIVGFVLTALHRPTGKVTWENQLVLPEYRGRGVGKALIEEMKKQLKTQGATYLHFLVKDGNQAVEYYDNLGFKKGHKFIWFDKIL